jgi:hypothetical protein
VALSTEERDTITRLSLRHDAEIPELEAYDRYYEGTQPLTYMHPEILLEVEDRIRPVIIFWPQMVVDSVEERLRLEGFRTGDEDEDDELRRIWRANEMVVGFRQATVDALVMRRSYVSVGTNEDDADTPIVTPESPLELYVDTDPRTRKIRSALRRVNDVDPLGGVGARYATLYQPNETIWCTFNGEWVEDKRDQHGLGEVAIAPLVNRGRLRSSTHTPRNRAVERVGRSDLDPVIPLSDAACKMASDMMVAGEFVAIPLRGVFGITPDDLVDPKTGNKLTTMQAIMGRLFTIGDTEAKAFEFAAAQLQNFTGGLRELAQLVAGISGLPPHYMGQAGDNPASAEAIASSEARLNTRAERKQDAFEIGAARAARLIRRFINGRWDPMPEVDWRDVRTPTVAARADAAVKLFQAGVVPKRQTREDLRYTEEQIDRMEAEDEKAARENPLAQIAQAASDQRMMDVAGGGANGREPMMVGAGAGGNGAARPGA